jgi:hypothetical protein
MCICDVYSPRLHRKIPCWHFFIHSRVYTGVYHGIRGFFAIDCYRFNGRNQLHIQG